MDILTLLSSDNYHTRFYPSSSSPPSPPPTPPSLFVPILQREHQNPILHTIQLNSRSESSCAAFISQDLECAGGILGYELSGDAWGKSDRSRAAEVVDGGDEGHGHDGELGRREQRDKPESEDEIEPGPELEVNMELEVTSPANEANEYLKSRESRLRSRSKNSNLHQDQDPDREATVREAEHKTEASITNINPDPSPTSRKRKRRTPETRGRPRTQSSSKTKDCAYPHTDPQNSLTKDDVLAVRPFLSLSLPLFPPLYPLPFPSHPSSHPSQPQLTPNSVAVYNSAPHKQPTDSVES